MSGSLPSDVAAWLAHHAAGRAEVTALTGDASDRRYFRVHPAAGPAFVLALHRTPFDPETLPFIDVARLFEAMGVPAPRLLAVAGEVGVLALEDLGNLTLQSVVETAAPAERDRLYERAVDLIVRIQTEGRRRADEGHVPYRLAFDREKLMWEMDFFIDHFIEGFRGCRLSAAERQALEVELAPIVEELALEPRVLCHRDYHSRNLMVRDGDLVVIDFQDARMGPDTYDLASLLRDSYVELPADRVEGLIARFASGAGQSHALAELRRRFDLMAVQRNLKALGTFGYQASSRGNPAYARYVPRTLGYVRENLGRYPRFGRLRDVLEHHLPELG